jgi:hypothetical protein
MHWRADEVNISRFVIAGLEFSAFIGSLYPAMEESDD